MLNLLIFVVLQSLLLPPRAAIENPAVASQIPLKIRKDYDKLWTRFVSGKEDAKLVKDLDKLIKKQKTFDPALIIEAYIDLYKRDDVAARQKLTQALTRSPNNPIALYYLCRNSVRAQRVRACNDSLCATARCGTPRGPILKPNGKRHSCLRRRNSCDLSRVLKARIGWQMPNSHYRQALTMLPKEPTLHARLADLLARENKKEEADAERKIAEDLMPRRAAITRVAEAPEKRHA